MMFDTTRKPYASIRLAWLIGLLIAVSSYTGVAFSEVPRLILNINTAIVPESSYPQYLGALGGKMLFGATDATGPALWATDGSTSGTILLRRLRVLAQIKFPGPTNYAVQSGRGYFIGDDGTTGPQLWSTDGTASGTAMVVNLGPSGTTASPVLYGLFGSLIIFSKVDASGVSQLYATDGTGAGTHALTSLTGQYSYVATEFLVVGSKFYFATGGVSIGAASGQIWVSDGTSAGTRPVTNPWGGNNSVGTSALYHPHSFALAGSSFLYLSSGLLWSVDTVTDTISAVTAIGGNAGFGPPNVNEAAGLISMDGYVLCLGSSGINQNQELWRSDGTSAGTYLIAVTNPGPLSFNAQQYPLFQKVGDRVIFIGSDAQYGSQLWSSDGTGANTVRLTSATQPANSPFQIVSHHATIAGIAYLSISDGAQMTTRSVWRTDGTAVGTMRAGGLPSVDQSEAGITQLTGDSGTVYVLIASSSGAKSLFRYAPPANATTSLHDALSISIIDGFLYAAGSLYFSNDDATKGNEPWVSDGTSAGTRLVADIYPQTTDSGSNPDEFVDFNGVLAFVASDGVHGRELWRSDGTSAGTTLLADINSGAVSSDPSHLFVANGTLYFFAKDASGTQKFMRLSGSPSSAQVLATLAPPVLPVFSQLQVPACVKDTPAVLNGGIYFAASAGATGVELWSTDGTAGGTYQVSDINPGSGDSNPCQLTVFGNRLYFSAAGPAGTELWASDGTSGGTVQVIDIAPGTAGSYPYGLVVFNGALYFGANDGTGGQLWQSNGLPSGTHPLGQVAPNTYSSPFPLGIANGKLLASAVIAAGQPGSYEYQLWSSDGTAAGTASLSALLTGPAFFTNGTLAYFSGTGAVGPEPWVSDGTSSGTHLLKDINPTAQSTLLWFADFNGTTLFGVSDPATGGQLWRSDGTATGTTLVSPAPVVTPSIFAAASNRHRLTVGQTFFFVGNDPATGKELYGFSNDPTVPTVTVSGSRSGGGSLDVLDLLGLLVLGALQINARRRSSNLISGT